MIDKVVALLWKIASALTAIVIIFIMAGVLSVGNFIEMAHLDEFLPFRYQENSKNEDYNRGYNAGLQASSPKHNEVPIESYYDTGESEEGNAKVWFTKSGECYHLDYNCYHIKNRDVNSDYLMNASKRLRPCEDCSAALINYYD